MAMDAPPAALQHTTVLLVEAVDALPKGEPPRTPGKIISAKAE